MPYKYISPDLKAACQRAKLRGPTYFKTFLEDAQVTERTVQRDARRYLQTKTYARTKFAPGRPRKVDTAAEQNILDQLAREPLSTIKQVQDQLSWNGVDIHPRTVRAALKRMGFSKRRVSAKAVERNEARRVAYLKRMATYSLEQMVFVDETHVDDRTCRPQEAWGEIGKRTMTSRSLKRGQRHTVLPAFHADGYIAMMVREDSVRKDQFMRFLRESLLPVMNPYPERRSVLVLDNCATHHDEEIVSLVHSRGVRIEYLPAYSPDFNPIENTFSIAKRHLQHHEWVCKSPTPLGDLQYLFFSFITPEKAKEILRGSPYANREIGYMPDQFWREEGLAR